MKDANKVKFYYCPICDIQHEFIDDITASLSFAHVEEWLQGRLN